MLADSITWNVFLILFAMVQVTPMVLRAEQVCTYDLDDVDQSWLNSFNGERALMALGPLTGILDKFKQ
jgi:hypothetical protein